LAETRMKKRRGGEEAVHRNFDKADTEKAGAEGRSCFALKRGRKERGINGTHTSWFRPRSLCIITIILVRCNPLRPGREGHIP
jgi:hypothetical protein